MTTLPAVAAAPCFMGKLATPDEYGRLIAEAPYNEMGADYQRVFGEFLYQQFAAPDNLREIAVEAFRARLALAKKHGTYFARQMELPQPGGNVTQRWLERFTGVTREPCWSFGIPGDDRPREVWEWFNQKLDLSKASLVHIDKARFLGLPGDVVVDDKPVRMWTFDLAPFTFRIYRVTSQQYYLTHLSDADVPRALERLDTLWRRALDYQLDKTRRAAAIAEFEWLWFWTNPFGRAGAVTGDVLSTLLQESLVRTGVPVVRRRTYEKQDFEAYVRTFSRYLAYRTATLLGP